METNNIIAAPQADGVKDLYNIWRKTNAGNMNHFYNFLTTPSSSRDEFYRSMSVETSFSGAIVTTTIKLPT